jgi:hypothetical protein
MLKVTKKKVVYLKGDAICIVDDLTSAICFFTRQYLNTTENKELTISMLNHLQKITEKLKEVVANESV